jgi:hypothetical protein
MRATEKLCCEESDWVQAQWFFNSDLCVFLDDLIRAKVLIKSQSLERDTVEAADGVKTLEAVSKCKTTKKAAKCP